MYQWPWKKIFFGAIAFIGFLETLYSFCSTPSFLREEYYQLFPGQNYSFKSYIPDSGPFKDRKIIEVHPKYGQWQPFFLATPFNNCPGGLLYYGPKGDVNRRGGLLETTTWGCEGKLIYRLSNQVADENTSYYLDCKKFPQKIIFGDYDGQSHCIDLNEFGDYKKCEDLFSSSRRSAPPSNFESYNLIRRD